MRRLLTGLAGTLLAIATATAAAPAAQAATLDNAKCAANSFCLFTGQNFTGTRITFPRGSVTCDLRGYDNTARSMINNTSSYVSVYIARGCDNNQRIYTAKPHTEDSTFVNNNFDKLASGVLVP